MKVFISRRLSADSEFVRLLTPLGWEIEDRSLVELTPLDFGTPPQADWIFFSSGYGVRCFFKKTTPGPSRCAALGPSTARILGQYVSHIHFIGNGDPQAVAETFGAVAAGQKVLFPAAKNSAQTLIRLLGNRIEAIPLPLYDNLPSPWAAPTDAQVLVFTSPMNAEAYFLKNTLRGNQAVVAIGATTARALAVLGIKEVVLASEASEPGLAEAVLRLSA